MFNFIDFAVQKRYKIVKDVPVKVGSICQKRAKCCPPSYWMTWGKVGVSQSAEYLLRGVWLMVDELRTEFVVAVEKKRMLVICQIT